MSPTVKGMKETHCFFLIICRAGFHHRTYQHLQQSASDGIDHNCNEKSHKRISQALRQYCEQNQTCSRHCMCQDHRCTITYSVHKSNRCQIYQQLDPEIKCNQKCDLLQRNPVTALKCQKQQRNEIVHNGLHHISDKTCLHCSVVICFHPMLYPPI